MYPDRESAIKELKIAEELNPGLWVKHSYNLAKAAEIIAVHCGMHKDKAYVCGLLHDIGRRAGIYQVRHIKDITKEQ